jgi:GntR family transcriptional repressor for pyruvate dehydrogenase complex
MPTTDAAGSGAGHVPDDDRQRGLYRLDPMSRRPLYQQIADRLKILIVEQELQPGDKLPTEHELAELFRASRSSVREALRFLQSLGVVQIRQRHGVVIQAPAISDLMEHLAYGLRFVCEPQTDLWEARLVLEAGALPLVCARLTPQGLTQLDEILAEMEKAIFAPPLFMKLDMEYHRTLLVLAGNTIILELAKVIEDFFSHPRNRIVTTPAQRRLFAQEHLQMRDALAASDLADAQGILLRHLWRYHGAWGKQPQVNMDGGVDIG